MPEEEKQEARGPRARGKRTVRVFHKDEQKPPSEGRGRETSQAEVGYGGVSKVMCPGSIWKEPGNL